jgi:hypothetical protein
MSKYNGKSNKQNGQRLHTKHNASKHGYKHIVTLSLGQRNHLTYIQKLTSSQITQEMIDNQADRMNGEY